MLANHIMQNNTSGITISSPSSTIHLGEVHTILKQSWAATNPSQNVLLFMLDPLWLETKMTYFPMPI